MEFRIDIFGISRAPQLTSPHYDGDLMRRMLLVCSFMLLASSMGFPADSGPLLLQEPTLSKAQIAFA
jgi:hypothetical protein